MGLFASVDEAAEIRDLGLEDVSIVSLSAGKVEKAAIGLKGRCARRPQFRLHHELLRHGIDFERGPSKLRHRLGGTGRELNRRRNLGRLPRPPARSPDRTALAGSWG